MAAVNATRSPDRRGVVDVLRALVTAAQSEQITFLAASLAYYAFVSLIPLLLLVLSVASVVGGDQLAGDVVVALGPVLSPAGQDLIRAALTGAAGRGGATVIGLLVLVWSGLKVFRGLDIAFSTLYGTEGEMSFLGQVKDALVVLVAVGAGIAVTIGGGAVISLSGVELAGPLGTLALVAALAVVFLPLYVVFPGQPVTVREALPGAVLSAAGWAALMTGFRIYAANAASFQLYGVIGGVLLLVTWFYFGGVVLLLGGVLNAVLADRMDGEAVDRQLQQASLRGDGQRTMSEDTDDADARGGADDDDLADLQAELAALEERIDERTVHRDDLESDLRRYVRRRVRRGKARGWGPYLVLLYGTAMTLGAFFFLNGVWAVLAMLVIWFSTLGLYALMVLVGATVGAARTPGRVLDAIRDFRR